MKNTFAKPLLQSMKAAPMDAVVTWVDGDDPVHQAKLAQHLSTLGAGVPSAAAPTRFRSVGEIDYCIASLLRFAPFIRYIHVVTDAQQPAIFRAAARWPSALREKLRLVDHRVLFAGHLDLLPTFNSLSIETLLFRIPDLAEHFVYLNDDFVLVKPVRPEDWFVDGEPVLQGQWRRAPQFRLSRRVRAWWAGRAGRPARAARPSYQDAQALAFALAGHGDRYVALNHNPHPLRRSTLERFYASRPELLRRNATPRLRDPSQYQSQALAAALELRAGTARLQPKPQVMNLKPSASSPARLLRCLQAVERRPGCLFACIQSLDMALAPAQAVVFDWLDRVVGLDPAPRPVASDAAPTERRLPARLSPRTEA